MTAPASMAPLIAKPYEVDLTIASPYQPWHPLVIRGVLDGVEEQTGVRLTGADLRPPSQVGSIAEGRRTLARKYRWTGTVITQPAKEWTPT